jgi:hypothetical protein
VRRGLRRLADHHAERTAALDRARQRLAVPGRHDRQRRQLGIAGAQRRDQAEAVVAAEPVADHDRVRRTGQLRAATICRNRPGRGQHRSLIGEAFGFQVDLLFEALHQGTHPARIRIADQDQGHARSMTPATWTSTTLDTIHVP